MEGGTATSCWPERPLALIVTVEEVLRLREHCFTYYY